MDVSERERGFCPFGLESIQKVPGLKWPIEITCARASEVWLGDPLYVNVDFSPKYRKIGPLLKSRLRV